MNMPRCLVHGDFVGKNIRVQNEPTGALSVIDWDIAGWGVPTVELEFLDVKHAWPQVSLEDVEVMKVIGVILRNLGLIQATSTGLERLARPHHRSVA